jgi:chlorobactene glucosyltransferase
MLRGLLLLALAASGVVIVLLAINLAALPRLSLAARRARPRRWPSVSIVIPARNEERGLEVAVRSHLSQDYPDFEVVVVDDRSSDRTPEILAALAGQDERLRVVPGQEPPAGWLGKPHALRVGADASRGEWILFVDADVQYEPRCLREAVAYLESEGLDFLAFMPRFEMRGFWEHVLMPNVALTYLFGPAALANSPHFRWIAAGGGAGNLVRRAVYEAIGGHAAIRSSVIDDVRLALLAKGAGFRCRGVRAEDRVSVRMYRGFREVCDGFTKNVADVFQGWVGVLATLLLVASTVSALLPAAALLAAALGAPLGPTDVRIGAAAFALGVAARLVVAGVLGHPIWTALTGPLMTAVWTWIFVRSAYRRLVRREVHWRGRRYDARQATF